MPLFLPLFFLLSTDHPTQQLGWLAGCWQMQRGSTVVEETWTPPAGGTLLGMGRTVREGKTVFVEFLQISEQAGKLTYTARIGSPGVTHFPLLELGEGTVTFFNPRHDFPQRIDYLKTATGITARISGTVKGTERRQEFVYLPISCSGK